MTSESKRRSHQARVVGDDRKLIVLAGLGSTKILALQLMRERAAEVGFSTTAYRRIGLLGSPARSACSSARSHR